MLAMNQLDIAWLAGIWDGEGSVGLTKNGTTYVLMSQMTHTHGPTVEHVSVLLTGLGVKHRIYFYAEKAAHHKPSWHIHASGLDPTSALERAIAEHSVTKRELWRLVRRWIDSRLAAGGPNRCRNRPYSGADHELAAQIRAIHKRPTPLPDRPGTREAGDADPLDRIHVGTSGGAKRRAPRPT